MGVHVKLYIAEIACELKGNKSQRFGDMVLTELVKRNNFQQLYF